MYTNVLRLTLAVTLFAMAASAQVTTGGLARDNATVVHPYSGTPLLSAFSFQYLQQEKCAFFNWGCEYREIAKDLRAIEVMPRNRGMGSLDVAFADSGGDEPYAFLASHYGLAAQGVSSRETFAFCEINAHPENPCRLSLEPSPVRDAVFVLVGFRMEFFNRDDEIHRIGLRERDGAVEVAFAPREIEPGFAYHVYLARVAYAWVPPQHLRRRDTSRGSAQGDGSATLPDGAIVIRGFDLRFDGSVARNLNRIAVRGFPGDRMSLADEGGGETFEWELDWAVLEPNAPISVPPSFIDRPVEE